MGLPMNTQDDMCHCRLESRSNNTVRDDEVNSGWQQHHYALFHFKRSRKEGRNEISFQLTLKIFFEFPSSILSLSNPVSSGLRRMQALSADVTWVL